MDTNVIPVTEHDDFADEVEDIVDLLPNELDRVWLDSFGSDCGWWLEENETLLRVAFWEAARAVIKAMLHAGYTLAPPAAEED